MHLLVEENVHNEGLKVRNCKRSQLLTAESAKLSKSNLANGTEDTRGVVRERRWHPIESLNGNFSQLSFNSKVAFSSDANKRNDIWSDSFWGLIVEVVKEAEMLADGTMANVRAALSGKAAITRPAKRAI